ncbi:WD40 repeat [Nonomuraea solani]|uniref:WD40 repeat n=1 Tax=Nonomuraea solani TaxID=1144553 RepID=A0A1H6EVU6_9ACTN|nr:hypothetical protein [Nonomuraea solani]SEH01166.1 WD40 repeat [Nonomuraea solani]
MGRPERKLDPDGGPLHQFAAELRELRTKAGKPSYRELSKRAHFSVTALAEAASGTMVPTLPVVLAYVVACGGDPEQWEERWRLLNDQIKGPEPAEEEAAPYLGLRTFQPQDARLFAGRERLVAALRERLLADSFLVVVGPSGSGKSSLLRAGLLPALRDDWPVALFTPGERPLRALAGRLAEAAGSSAKAVLEAVLDDPRNVAVQVGSRLLIVVDQFEEIFTLCPSEAERRAFIAALVAAAAEPSCRVVVGVRADFYARCAGYPELVPALQDGQLLVGPMDDDDLREVVKEPARRMDVHVSAELVELVVDEARGQAGALSLVSHALLETWRRRRGNALTVAGYRATGGVRGAIAQTAERVYGALTTGEREQAKHLFLRLVTPGDGTEDARRRAARTELSGNGHMVMNGSVAGVLDRLIAARLITADEESVTIAHEALIRGWPRLGGWLSENRELLQAHRRLTEAAAEWDQHGRDEAFLYRGVRLAGWDDRPGDRLNALEHAFLDASRHRQSAARTRRRRRVRLVVGGLIAVVAVVSVLAGLALTQTREVSVQRDIALSRQLAAEAQGELALNPGRGLRLAGRAHVLWPTVEADTALRQALIDDRLLRTMPGFGRTLGVTFSPDGGRVAVTTADGLVRIWAWEQGRLSARPQVVLSGHEGEAWSPAFSRDGRRLVTAGLDGTVRVWDPAGGADPVVLRGHKGPVWGVAFTTDGRRVASTGEDGTLRIWDVAGRADPRVLRAGKGTFFGLAVSPDGRHVATSSSDTLIRVWDLSGRADPVVLKGHESMVKRMAYNADGTRLASAGIDGTVRVWPMDERDAVPVVLRGHEGSVEGVTFSPDGHRVVASGDDGSIRVFGPAGGGDPLVLRGHDRVVWNADSSADGRYLVSVGDDGTIRVWDTRVMGESVIMRGHRGEVWNLCLSPDGTQIASGGADKDVRLWDVSGKRAPRVLQGHTGQIYGLAFGPGGRLLATGSGDGTVRLWDTTGDAEPVVWRGHTEPVGAVAFRPDGRDVASVSNDGTLRVWPVGGTGRPRVIKVSPEMVRYVAYSPDSRYIATSGLDGLVRLYDTTTYGPPTELRGHEGMVWAVSFSADGRRLASAGTDATVRIWDVAGHAAPLVLRGHQGAVWQVAFTPDGRWVAAGGHDDTLRMWRDGKPGTPLTVTGFAATVEAVQFLPSGPASTAGTALPEDGTPAGASPAHGGEGAVRLVTAHGDGTVRMWTCDACAPIERVLAEANARLTAPPE